MAVLIDMDMRCQLSLEMRAASLHKPNAPRAGAQGAKPDYLYLLQRMCMDNPEAAVGLAKSVARQPGPPIELNTLADVFLQRNMVREATAFLLDVLQGDDPAHDKLQTKARPRARAGPRWG